jgi:hypothetical protein
MRAKAQKILDEVLADFETVTDEEVALDNEEIRLIYLGYEWAFEYKIAFNCVHGFCTSGPGPQCDNFPFCFPLGFSR